MPRINCNQDSSGLTPECKVLEGKVNALISKMSLDEKIGQLVLISNGPLMDWEAVRNGTAGALINFNNAQDIAKAQEMTAKTRLAIPLLIGLDVVHGFRTQFPTPLGEAAAFDPDLSRRVAKAMAEEARYVGVNWTYAPMADLSRDPRWGRIIEGFGEDPYLGSLLTAARVEGIQAGGLVATVKHFAGYGAPAGGREYAETLIPQSELYNFYLPPYHAGVRAGAGSVMSAFNALNGKPSTANRFLLSDLLRDQWKFDGFVTSDWGAVQELMAHGIAANELIATAIAINAGVDMDMMSKLYKRNLYKAIQLGLVSEETLNQAVRRVLLTKYRFGLFEAPHTPAERVDTVFPTDASRGLAREAAVKSFVLLKNSSDLLPISQDVKSISVIGPLADRPCEQLGPHAARGGCEDAVSYLKGIEKRASQSGVKVSYQAGCDIFCTDELKIEDAVATAKTTDVIIAVLGEPRDASGEAASKVHFGLSGEQENLLDGLLKTDKPVVLVIMAGRPLDITRYQEKLGAILMTWYPGTEGGNAVADVLFGDKAPVGKLPLTYPRAVGQVPVYYNHLPSGRPHLDDNRFTYGYYDESYLPLYPFGWGLTYTSFNYSDLKIEKAEHLNVEQDSLKLSVLVQNTGDRSGEEIVQVYVRKPFDEESRPVRELKAFSKVSLAAGEAKTVQFEIPLQNLSFYKEGQTEVAYQVSPGGYQLWVGGNSDARLSAEFSIEKGSIFGARFQ
ncbi:glycoside hydrolase family 3 N-terminal domain-containing protein [Microvirga sp. W0021]|uniref:Glycoside hydrolase family 3 N-terminal domain-containing protein n=1 Tax=Hohaiivirga grylli TaxID=3133970 RepID=A0ABV0BKZ9_9HYPH